MLTKKHLPNLLVFILCAELIIYVWAVWTSTFTKSNFFAIEPEFIFDKCARNSGRISAAIVLVTLILVGNYGLKEIFRDAAKRKTLRILITLFACNHLVHFLFLYLRFKSHASPLTIGANLHGFITFISILVLPIILWTHISLTKWLYWTIIFYLLNVSLFINLTFLHKIKPDHPAYHNRFGIVVLTVACLYIIYRAFLENRDKQSDKETMQI